MLCSLSPFYQRGQPSLIGSRTRDSRVEHPTPPSTIATVSSARDFTFGFETEIYLKPNTSTVSKELTSRGWTIGHPLNSKARNINRVAILETVANILVKSAELTAVVPDGELDDIYTEWLVKGDSSLSEDTELDYYGVEIVSPVMSVRESKWTTELKSLFSVLQDAFHLSTNHACSAHIHIQPVGGWKPADIRSLFKATAAFDDAITRVIPARKYTTVSNLQEFIQRGLIHLAACTHNSLWTKVVDTRSFKEDESKPYTLTIYSAALIWAKLLKAEKQHSAGFGAIL
ncbi:hypothetical protein BT67DRAFT_278012 [Trichocladium antarcticum]|uniref:Amidoligase n=1 Tax=Trichocladium antarcticum TaxID=1450529 RepID=A0AAN6UMH1_9PEZI|nr:hypothetical protein BT67DRAFT_278012 [Trichocladium antarcticum]